MLKSVAANVLALNNDGSPGNLTATIRTTGSSAQALADALLTDDALLMIQNLERKWGECHLPSLQQQLPEVKVQVWRMARARLPAFVVRVRVSHAHISRMSRASHTRVCARKEILHTVYNSLELKGRILARQRPLRERQAVDVVNALRNRSLISLNQMFRRGNLQVSRWNGCLSTFTDPSAVARARAHTHTHAAVACARARTHTCALTHTHIARMRMQARKHTRARART